MFKKAALVFAAALGLTFAASGVADAATTLMETKTLTGCDSTGHCGKLKMDWYHRTAVVNGHTQHQVYADVIGTCWSGSNPSYACRSMFGSFSYVEDDGPLTIPIDCGGSSPACQASQHFTTGWLFTSCGSAVFERYVKGDVYFQTGTGLVHLVGRTTGLFVAFLCP